MPFSPFTASPVLPPTAPCKASDMPLAAFLLSSVAAIKPEASPSILIVAPSLIIVFR